LELIYLTGTPEVFTPKNLERSSKLLGVKKGKKSFPLEVISTSFKTLEGKKG
jgi:hypothetical protein